MEKKDFTQITEEPGSRVTPEQVLRVYQRYRFAAGYCVGKKVLELACGGGSGLGLLAETASEVVALDIEPKNLERARTAYPASDKIRILEGDAMRVPFPDSSFDTVILFEAIYYLPSAENFLKECRRVLKPSGHLIIGSANREWKDFNPSTFSTRYFSALELKDLMERHGFSTALFHGFPVNGGGIKGVALSRLKRLAVHLHLIPKSMKYKKFLKRIFVGRLVELPRRLTEGSAEYLPPLPLDLSVSDGQFKVIYALGERKVAP